MPENKPSTNPQAPDQALGLTVHDLPNPNMAHSAAPDARRARLGRLKMFMVLVLCASPVIASYFMYYVVRPQARHNYGELVIQRAMPATLTGQNALKVGPANSTPTPPPRQSLTQLRDQWLLISVAPAACGAACEKHLYLQRQLRETLGKEKERLEWVWLVTDAAPLPQKLTPALKDAVVWRVDPLELAQWLSPAAGQRLEDHLYVIDPIGNFMMRFPAELDAKKAKRDLDRLLRASRSWDTAGRDATAAAKLPTASTPAPK